MNALISRDERVSSNPVARIVFGDPAAFLPQLPRDSKVHCSRMWSCRTRITLEHLRHVVEQKNGKETVPLLWRFLQKVGPGARRGASLVLTGGRLTPCFRVGSFFVFFC